MATPRKPAPPRRTAVTSRSAASSGNRTSGARAGGAARGATRADPRTGGRAAKAPSRPERGTAGQPGAPAVAKKRPVLGPPPVLTTKQRCHLRALGHHLAPVVQVGKEGLTDALGQAIGIALAHHELIKLRLAESVDGDRHELAAQIAAQSHAALVQVLGRTLLLFRPRPPEDRDADERRPHVTLH